MAITPLQLLVSLNGGAYTHGWQQAAFGQTVAMQLASTAGLTAVRYEIYDFPPTFSVPSGWSVDGVTGVYFFSPTNVTTAPPTVTLPGSSAALFGFYMFRVRGNTNPLRLNADGSPNVSYAPGLTDEGTCVDIPGPLSGQPCVGFGLTTQYKADSQRQWVRALEDSLRALEGAVGGGGGVGFGSADQFYVTNHAGSAAAWTSLTGDVSYNAGAGTVVGIQTKPVPAPSGTGTALTWNAGGSGLFSWVVPSGGSGIGFGTADQFYVTNHAGTAAAWTSLTGDVAYNAGAGVVVAIQTKPVPAPSGVAASLTWNVGGSGLFSWVVGGVGVGTANQFYVTNPAGSAAVWTSLTGDVSYTGGAGTVVGIQTRAVPTPTGVGAALTWNFGGSGAFAWIVPSGGGSSVGWANDLAGSSNTNQYLTAIGSGSSPIANGTLPLTINALQFGVSQSAPTFSQLTQTGNITAPQNMVVAPQGPFASATTVARQTPGSFNVNVSAPVGSGVNAGLLVSQAGVASALTAQMPISNLISETIGGIWLGTSAAAPTTSNWHIGVGRTSGTFIAEAAGQGAYLQMTTAGAVLLGGNTTTSVVRLGSLGGMVAQSGNTQLRSDANAPGVEAGVIGIQKYTALNHFTLSGGITATQLPSNAGSGVTFVANASVVPVAGPTSGGALLFASAGALWVQQAVGSLGTLQFQIQPPGGGGTVTGSDVAGSDNAHVFVGKVSGFSGSGSAVQVQSNAWFNITGAPGVSFLNAGSGTGAPCIYIDVSGNLVYSSPTHFTRIGVNAGIGSVANFTDGAAGGMQLIPNAANSFLIGYPTGVSGTGASVNIVPQSSTASTSGSLNVQLSAPGGGGIEAGLIIGRTGTPMFQMGCINPFPGSVQPSIYMGSSASAPSATNYQLSYQANSTLLNTNKFLFLQVGASNQLTFNGITAGFESTAALQGSLTNGTPLAYGQSPNIPVSGGLITIDLSSAGTGQCAYPIITLSGTQTGNVRVLFPNPTTGQRSWWILDMTQVTNGGFNCSILSASAFGAALAGGQSYLIWIDQQLVMRHIQFS